MNRQEFTVKIMQLLKQMIDEGDKPVIDWALRDAYIQKHLFDLKLSKCDGITKKSAHQFGTAVDIYLTDDKGNIVFDTNNPTNIEYKKRILYWHSVWDKMLGGDKMITWDSPHFEG